MATATVEQIPGQEPGAVVTKPTEPAEKSATGPTPAGGGNEPGAKPNEPAEKVFTFKEDRSDWIPRSRLNDESGKRTKLETRLQQLEGELELRDKRLRLAMGLEVPSKEDQEMNELREGLYRLNPKLKLLDRLEEDDIERLLQAAESAESTSQATWARHREEMFAHLEDEVADLVGVEKLSEAQSARLRRDFRSFAREEAAKRERAEKAQDANYDSRNDFIARYERGDKTLLKEFAKSFIDEWVTPVRRQANASALNRQNRPVPNGGRGRAALTQKPPDINYNDEGAFKKAILDARRGGDDGV